MKHHSVTDKLLCVCVIGMFFIMKKIDFLPLCGLLFRLAFCLYFFFVYNKVSR